MLTVAVVFGLQSPAKADDFNKKNSFESDGTVEVEYAPDIFEPYRDRRSNWSLSMAFTQENMKPSKFTSSQDGASYSTLFGSATLPLYQVALGAKYNFSLGALSFEGVLGSGQVSGSSSGAVRTLSLSKKGVQVGWTLDAIFHEPYVAPYVMGQVFELDYADKGAVVADPTTTTGPASGTTAVTTGVTVGLLIQLNSIDPTDAALRANWEYGLNNTYLDIFATQHNTSNATDDPKLETAFDWGAGLRLEF